MPQGEPNTVNAVNNNLKGLNIHVVAIKSHQQLAAENSIFILYYYSFFKYTLRKLDVLIQDVSQIYQTSEMF